MKKISLKDISKSLNISTATISYVLNDRGDEKRVSKETQKKIIDFARENNYNANQVARSLSIGKSNMIGLVLPNISDTFFARIARRIEKKAIQSGYDVIFSSTGENIELEQKIIQSMLDRKVDGLILVSCQKNDRDILNLTQNNFPLVLIDRRYPNVNTNFIGIDNSGITSLVNQLIKSGRKRIGFVSLNMDLVALRERLDYYLKTMELNGLCVESGFVQELEYEHSEGEMKNVMEKMSKNPINIDSLVFATHFLAADGIRELKAMNVKIPHDVAVVSYGQKKDFDLFEPPITAVSFPIEEIGDKAVDLLLENLKNPTMDSKEVFVETELIVRKSCGSS